MQESVPVMTPLEIFHYTAFDLSFYSCSNENAGRRLVVVCVKYPKMGLDYVGLNEKVFAQLDEIKAEYYRYRRSSPTVTIQ